MAQQVQEVGTSYTILLSGNVQVKMPEPVRKNVPIRLYVTGATDPGSPSTGISDYFITIRKSKLASDETTLAGIAPSGIVALTKEHSVYQTFISGYEPQIFQRLNVESSPFFSGGIAEAALYKNTTNPGSGMMYPSGDFVYNSTYVYMFQIYNWEKETYYWFYVGSIDKAGNISKFSQMSAHGQNPWYGNVPSGVYTLPLEDVTAPTGMAFYY